MGTAIPHHRRAEAVEAAPGFSARRVGSPLGCAQPVLTARSSTVPHGSRTPTTQHAGDVHGNAVDGESPGQAGAAGREMWIVPLSTAAAGGRTGEKFRKMLGNITKANKLNKAGFLAVYRRDAGAATGMAILLRLRGLQYGCSVIHLPFRAFGFIFLSRFMKLIYIF
jgi:hypothetical protein